jgi:hypothetical protein
MPCAVAICASLSMRATCTGHEPLPRRRVGVVYNVRPMHLTFLAPLET